MAAPMLLPFLLPPAPPPAPPPLAFLPPTALASLAFSASCLLVMVGRGRGCHGYVCMVFVVMEGVASQARLLLAPGDEGEAGIGARVRV